MRADWPQKAQKPQKDSAEITKRNNRPVTGLRRIFGLRSTLETRVSADISYWP